MTPWIAFSSISSLSNLTSSTGTVRSSTGTLSIALICYPDPQFSNSASLSLHRGDQGPLLGTFGLLLCWCYIGTLQQPRGSCKEGTNVSANGRSWISFLTIIVLVIKTITLKDLGEAEEVCWTDLSPNLIHSIRILQERRQIKSYAILYHITALMAPRETTLTARHIETEASLAKVV